MRKCVYNLFLVTGYDPEIWASRASRGTWLVKGHVYPSNIYRAPSLHQALSRVLAYEGEQDMVLGFTEVWRYRHQCSY